MPEGSVAFDVRVPVDRAWAFLSDMQKVGSCVPGVEAIETRAAQEALAGRVQTLVVALGDWFPDVAPTLAVVDPIVVAALDAPARVRAMDELRERTVHRGVHLVLPAQQRTDVRSLPPEALLAHYAGWQVERGPRACGRWFLAIKP